MENSVLRRALSVTNSQEQKQLGQLNDEGIRRDDIYATNEAWPNEETLSPNEVKRLNKKAGKDKRHEMTVMKNKATAKNP